MKHERAFLSMAFVGALLGVLGENWLSYHAATLAVYAYLIAAAVLAVALLLLIEGWKGFGPWRGFFHDVPVEMPKL